MYAQPFAYASPSPSSSTSITTSVSASASASTPKVRGDGECGFWGPESLRQGTPTASSSHGLFHTSVPAVSTTAVVVAVLVCTARPQSDASTPAPLLQLSTAVELAATAATAARQQPSTSHRKSQVIHALQLLSLCARFVNTPASKAACNALAGWPCRCIRCVCCCCYCLQQSWHRDCGAHADAEPCRAALHRQAHHQALHPGVHCQLPHACSSTMPRPLTL